MIPRNCDFCGVDYIAKRQASRFCSERCRKRNSRAPARAVARLADATEPLPDSDEFVEVHRRALAAAGLDESDWRWHSVLLLAERMASPLETGSAVVALSKELQAVMREVAASAPATVNALDELRARRDRTRRGYPR